MTARVAALVLAFLLASPLAGLDGEVDTAFGTNGEVSASPDLSFPPWDSALAAVVDGDGRLFLGGSSVSGPPFATRARGTLVRFRPDGSPDLGFGTTGLLQWGPAPNTTILAALFDPEGRLVLVAQTNSPFPGQPTPFHFTVGRFSADGTPDATFGTGGSVTHTLGNAWSLYDLVATFDGEGRLLIGGGRAPDFAGTLPVEFFLARLDATGALDPTFDQDGWITSRTCPEGDGIRTNDLEVLTNGWIALGGACLAPGGGGTAGTVEYFLPDGTSLPQVEPLFGRGGATPCGEVYRLLAGPEGGVWVAATTCETSATPRVVLAFVPPVPVDSLDSFGQPAQVRGLEVADGVPFGLLNHGDGHLLLARRVGTDAFVERRLATDFSLDPTWTTVTTQYPDTSTSYRDVVTAGGRPVIYGTTTLVTEQGRDFVAKRLDNKTVFNDNFEQGLGRWSRVVGLAL